MESRALERKTMIAPPKKILGVTVDPPIHDRAWWTVFGCLIFLRILAACSRVDMIWPDEHFQTLEPAYGVVNGVWTKAWEWSEGFRSWIPPSLFIPLFWVMKLFGVTGGAGLVIAARIQVGLISLLVPWGMNRLALNEGWSRFTRVGMLIAYLSNQALNLWGPAPLTDSLSTSLIWGFYPLAYEALLSKKAFRAGFLVSLPFLLRPHAGIFALCFGIFVCLRKDLRTLAPRVLLGGLSIGALYGLVDWITWGAPFRSLYLQFVRGIKLSEFYGVDPWYAYFFKIIEDQGMIGLTVSILFLGFGIFRAKKKAQSSIIPWVG